MNQWSKWLAAALLFVGGVLLVQPQGCEIPSIPIVQKQYPDAWLVIVEESSQRTKEVALLAQDLNWRRSLDEREIKFRIYDIDQPEAKSYKSLSVPVPSYVFIRPNGEVVAIGEVPKVDTKKSVEKLITEVTGK
jgi:hypothetical protein